METKKLTIEMAHTQKSHVKDSCKDNRKVEQKILSLAHKRKRKKNEFGMNAEKLLNNAGAESNGSHKFPT